MNYFALLTEMSKDYDIILCKFDDVDEPWTLATWRCELYEKENDNYRPAFEVIDDTPEGAIRKAYLAINPLTPTNKPVS